jgi:hypothetical protein
LDGHPPKYYPGPGTNILLDFGDQMGTSMSNVARHAPFSKDNILRLVYICYLKGICSLAILRLNTLKVQFKVEMEFIWAAVAIISFHPEASTATAWQPGQYKFSLQICLKSDLY